MSGAQDTLAIVFADIRGSTAIYETYGDVRARTLTSAALDTFCGAVEAQSGTVIKTMGDGAMVVLPSAEAALLAAITVQERQSASPVKLGIGIQWGSVVREHNDVFGDAVNVAARLCGLAKAGEILTTAETVRRFPAMLQPMARRLDSIAVRGRKEPVEIHQVIWEGGNDATMTVIAHRDPSHSAGKRPRTLTLTYDRRTIRFDNRSEPLRLGRLQADVVVPDSQASRQHATIENWRGKFMLIDQSTNGTYVLFDHGAQTVLKRESGELAENGWIGLGRIAGDENPFRLRFVVEPGDE